MNVELSNASHSMKDKLLGLTLEFPCNRVESADVQDSKLLNSLKCNNVDL